jgi:hypothetical protein
MPCNHLYLTQVVTLFFSSFYSVHPMCLLMRCGGGVQAELGIDNQNFQRQPTPAINSQYPTTVTRVHVQSATKNNERQSTPPIINPT